MLHANLQPGFVFGDQYEVVSLLGRGGFGVVYRAMQCTTKQQVALKVIDAPLVVDDEDRFERLKTRFVREVQFCARLHHPNIVPLLDCGENADGQLYAVFSYAPGRNLNEVLRQDGPLAFAETVHLMGQVLEALGAAHRQGVVHRDLKPANIMLTDSGVRRSAVVLDFGVGAFVQAEQERTQMRLTRDEVVLGTPSYASPEQIRGVPPTPRVDLYSWGLVCIECLSGVPVVHEATMHAALQRHLDEHPHQLPADVERYPLAPVLSRAIEKDPERRYATADELLADLERYSRQPLVQTHVTTQLETGHPVTSRRLPMAESGERRQVTCISCRFSVAAVGDDEIEVHSQALRLLQQACAVVAERRGGYLTDVSSEGALIVFGVPVAQEDDPRRAVDAALHLAAHVQERGAAWGRAGLELRVGISTGAVVVSNPDQTPASAPYATGAAVSGPAIAAASRLATRSEPFAVVVGQRTYDLVHQCFVFEACDYGDTPVWICTSRTSRDARTEPSEEQTPLVGRSHELGLLSERWREARTGVGQAVLVTGEPGIGKSRLALELVQEARIQGGLVIECRCAEENRGDLWRPVIDLVETILDLQPAEDNRSKLAQVESRLSELQLSTEEIVLPLAHMLSLSMDGAVAATNLAPEQQKQASIDAVLTLLLLLAESRPVLLLVEDLHWADSTTLDFVTQLVDEVGSGSLCVLLTARSEFVPTWSATQFAHLQLGRLGWEHMAEILSRAAREKDLPAAVVETICRRADGVALFVEELARALLSSGILEERESSYELAGNLDESAIPDTLWGLLASRLDRLGDARHTAQLASALGNDFSLELLRAVSPLSDDELDADLSVLVEAQLVRRVRRRQGLTYAFRHAMIRDVAYGSLLLADRRAIHAAIAKTIEAHFEPLVRSRPDLMALHYAAADQKQMALGFARRAARDALHRSAHREAFRLGREALGWLPSISDERERAELELDLHLTTIPALMVLEGCASEAFAWAAQRSVELVETLGDSRHMDQILFAIALYQHNRLEFRQQARDVAELIVSRAEAAGDASLQGPALTLLAQCFWTEGDHREARRLLECAIAMYESMARERYLALAGVDLLAWAKMTLGQVVLTLGEPLRAVELCRAALAHGRALRQAQTEAMALLSLGLVLQARGDRIGALQILAELEAVSRRQGLSQYDVLLDLLRAWAAADGSGAGAALERLPLPVRGVTQFRAVVAQALLAEGRPDAAYQMAQGGVELAEEYREAYYRLSLQRIIGDCLLRLGQAKEADAVLTRCMTEAREGGQWFTLVQVASVLARSSLVRSSPERVGSLSRDLAAARGAAGELDGDVAEVQKLLEEPL